MLITRRKFHDKVTLIAYLDSVDEKYKQGTSVLSATHLLNGLAIEDIDLDIVFELFDFIPAKYVRQSNLEILTDYDDYIERVFCNSFDRNELQPSKFTIQKIVCSKEIEIPYIEGRSDSEGEFEFDKDKCIEGDYPRDVPIYFLREFEMLTLEEGKYIPKRYHYDVFVYIPRNLSVNAEQLRD